VDVLVDAEGLRKEIEKGSPPERAKHWTSLELYITTGGKYKTKDRRKSLGDKCRLATGDQTDGGKEFIVDR